MKESYKLKSVKMHDFKFYCVLIFFLLAAIVIHTLMPKQYELKEKPFLPQIDKVPSFFH